MKTKKPSSIIKLFLALLSCVSIQCAYSQESINIIPMQDNGDDLFSNWSRHGRASIGAPSTAIGESFKLPVKEFTYPPSWSVNLPLNLKVSFEYHVRFNARLSLTNTNAQCQMLRSTINFYDLNDSPINRKSYDYNITGNSQWVDVTSDPTEVPETTSYIVLALSLAGDEYCPGEHAYFDQVKLLLEEVEIPDICIVDHSYCANTAQAAEFDFIGACTSDDTCYEYNSCNIEPGKLRADYCMDLAEDNNVYQNAYDECEATYCD